MQERVERKELSVGAVPSSENVADIGTKRLSVPTMKYLMLNLGVFDSETCSLVGQDEYEMKVSKENLRLIATSPNFKVSANLIRLLVASSLASADALSCGTALSAAMDMAWIDWSTMDGVGVNLFKFPFMQLYYLIQLLFMQLSFIFEYAQTWMHGFAYLTGWLCVITFAICLGCRIFFGRDAIDSTPGRVFVLFGDILQCMGHHLLEWYCEKKIKHWQRECQKCFDVKGRDGIKHAQEMMISWRHYLRVLQGIVHGFFDEEPSESAPDRLQRYQNSSLTECSSPSFWQEVHHGTIDDLSDEDFVANYDCQGVRTA